MALKRRDFKNTYKAFDVIFDKIENNKKLNKYRGYRPKGYSLKITDGKIKMVFKMPDHFRFVEYGRRPGKMPPHAPIAKWIKDKRILTRGKLSTAIYLIRRKIGLRGTKGKKIFYPTLGGLMKGQQKKISEAYVKDYAEEIIKITFKGKKLFR